MAACEKCWVEFKRRQWSNPGLTYSMVTAENNGRCTPEDMCGDMHLVLPWKDKRPDQCRCGKVVRPLTEKERECYEPY